MDKNYKRYLLKLIRKKKMDVENLYFSKPMNA